MTYIFLKGDESDDEPPLKMRKTNVDEEITQNLAAFKELPFHPLPRYSTLTYKYSLAHPKL